MARVREPSVAGTFYEAEPASLRSRIEWCFKHSLGPAKIPVVNKLGKRNLLGLISPHAGYLYSGPIAAHGYSALAEDGCIDVAVILGPNHHGVGAPIAVYPEGVWRTPLGEVKVANELVGKLVKESSIVEEDEEAHLLEHSIEVQLPFLQYIYGDNFSILPITMYLQTPEAGMELGKALIKVLEGLNFVIIASTDFSHYEYYEVAKRKDKRAIEAILKMEPKELYNRVIEEDITMCGYGPVMTLLYALGEVGGIEAKLLKYATSGDVTGDYSSVVGYASIAFKKG
ncbi:MAG: AmmeMemoRadiSam system protein B [Thermofilum sp. ex4484_15]|nr:MAG: AmmeMemoRadiSam system protein B [Thermofilum sp. ex4484_15]